MGECTGGLGEGLLVFMFPSKKEGTYGLVGRGLEVDGGVD